MGITEPDELSIDWCVLKIKANLGLQPLTEIAESPRGQSGTSQDTYRYSLLASMGAFTGGIGTRPSTVQPAFQRGGEDHFFFDLTETVVVSNGDLVLDEIELFLEKDASAPAQALSWLPSRLEICSMDQEVSTRRLPRYRLTRARWWATSCR